MGGAALVSHAKGKKHLDNQKAAQQTASIGTCFTPQPAVVARPDNTASTSTAGIIAARQPTLNQSIAASNDLLSAEVMWTLKTMDSHYSYSSCANTGKLFRAMFPDSEIAAKFSCGETKCAYLTTFGIAPYFKWLVVREVSRQAGYVMMFNESLNKALQLKQMDLHVRIWDGGEMKTRYIGSEFLGHATAQDIVERMQNMLSETGMKNLVQLSMDGPNSKAKQVIPFLVQYQTDKPMLPFMSEDVYKLIKGLMDCFIKEKTMKEATSVYKILQVPFDQASEHKDASKVDIGFAAEAALRKLKSQKISERQGSENLTPPQIEWTLFHETMGSSTEFKRLRDVVKVLLVMSHGQASVERGFSVNKEVEVENLKEQSLVAQRFIIDHIRAVEGVCKVQITKELLTSAAGARQKYCAYLDEQKRERSRKTLAMKRKSLMDELGELKKKGARVEADASALEKAADEYANKAETTSKLTFIAVQQPPPFSQRKESKSAGH
ncbi:hypothetical protein SKAU_G00057970 [Synaphobranchus kaupii]|uniref:Uncharacterized protein n=1 Tax=Synaphobranchus kaupii TaxID=118154 RepID=A0A9Q1G4B6_SYNKA|nr:hypothetical protein SKAU_G00057970 [Synaphobranchus kaupii]